MEIMNDKNIPEKLDYYIKNNNVGILIKFLDRLGRLTSEFDNELLLKLLSHHNEKVRYLAIKNLAKLSNINLLETYAKVNN